MPHQQTIYTITANCQDCYRCVRECPVKAIRISGGQAMIEDNLCIKCGTCIRECPQNAKVVRSDLQEARELFIEGKCVAVSVAPSFAALFTDKIAAWLPSALRSLGFSFVGETAEGARYISDKTFENTNAKGICTACPGVVNYIEKYHPEYIDNLFAIVSPMIAHGRMLKDKINNCSVVFIGPCAAKKHEITRTENIGAVDVVLTFEELFEWLKIENIDLENCSESSFDSFYEIGSARLYPVQGGMLKSANINCDGTQTEIIHISGADEVIELFSGTQNIGKKIIEPLFCKNGCIGGPFFGKDFSQNIFTRKDRVINYAKKAVNNDNNAIQKEILHTAFFVNNEQKPDEISENQVNRILENTGKIDPVYQLNCGACGYKTCLKNAQAVARGMAEPEMCIPYMRRLAQQRTDKIIETTPNGIIILDSELCMIKMNPAFQKMFMCNNGILGRKISYLVNADGFEILQSGQMDQYESIQSKYGIKYHEILYTLKDERQYIGIYSDISKMNFDKNQLDTIKSQTIMHAREFLDHQIKFAQEMAHYLGKSTAQSEEIARRLISLYENDDKNKEK